MNDPFARVAGKSLRVVSWNGELGAIISRPEAFIRTLDAIAPDVIRAQRLGNLGVDLAVLKLTE